MIIGIALGALCQPVGGLAMPGPVTSAVDMVAARRNPDRAVRPRRRARGLRPEGDLRLVAFIVAVSLVMHPAIVFGLGHPVRISAPASCAPPC